LVESLTICRVQRYLWCIPYLLEGIAVPALRNGQARPAAQLVGAAEALHEQIGAPLPPIRQADLVRRLAPLREALGEAAYGLALDEGRTLTIDAAIELAPAVEPPGGAKGG
jgi:hypothetical protein